MMSTSRASRSSKENPSKAQHVKSVVAMKTQTTEQMRVGQISADRADAVDPVLQKKVNQVVELTGRSKDEVIVALHDCDNDPNRAINMLLEGENDQGEWQESGKRRKRQPQPPVETRTQPNTAASAFNSKPDRRDKSRDRDRDDRHDSAPPRRGRQPPRLARKNREYEENERNRTDSGSRDRGGFEGRRGRGRGMMNGPGRGRGGRGGRRGDRGGGSSRYDRGSSGPSIGTWTNETAENAEKDNSNDFPVSTWTDTMTEDWGDEWTGSLEETKVFTASENNPPFGTNDSSKVFGGIGDNDAKMFSAPPETTTETTVFNSLAAFTSAATNGNALSDATNSLHTNTSIQNAIGTDPLGQSALNQNSLGGAGLSSLTSGSLTSSSLSSGAMGQSSTLGQRLDIGMLLKSAEAEAVTQQQQSQFISQFTKPAVDSPRQNSVGLGSSVPISQDSSASMSVASLHSRQTPQSMSQSLTQAITQSMTQAITQTLSQSINQSMSQATPQQQAAHVLAQQQRPKPQRSKLPPPSKIPQNAVEMPGHLGTFNLDVQFGNWDGGFGFGVPPPTEPPTSYTTTVSSSSPTSVLSNHLPATSPSISEDVTSTLSSSTISSPSPAKNTAALDAITLDAITQAATQSSQHTSAVFPSAQPQSPKTPTTTDYSSQHQNALPQGSQMSPPEPIPFPSSQSDRKSSPHYSQRSTSNTGSMSNKSNNSPASMGFNQSYSSSYQSYGSQKGSSSSGSMNSTPSSYSHPVSQSSNSLSSSGLQGHMSNSQSGSGAYGSHAQYQAFHSQAGYSSSQAPNSSSLYQGTSSQSTYQSHPSAQSGSSAYQNQTATYHSSRDSQSTNSYQAAVSQSGSYPSGSQTNSYQSSSSQSASSYPSAGSHTGNSPYQRDSTSNQSNYNSSQTYGSSSSSHQSSLPMTTNKLSDGLQKMTVKENSLDSRQTSAQYDHSSSTVTTASHSTATSTLATASLSSSNVSVSSALGLSSTTTTSVTSISMATGAKTALPLTSKAPPNLPQGVPPLISNYMIGQPAGMPFAFAGLPQQQAMYSYEELQLLTQRLPMPPTTLPGRDQGLASAPYTGTDGKLSRLEAQSPVQAQTSQQQQQQQTQSAHQQFISPGLPHYNYYYPGIVPGGYSYPPTMFPVPPVTNTAHAGSSANAQFQKPASYAGSHAYGTATYDDLSSQGQDFKTYGASQTASKVSAASAVTSSGTDLAGTGYGKTHTQSFDKAGFAAGTPPPFNLALSSGSQAGPMGPTAAYGAPYMPVMAHQPHSQMLHHHLPQDSTGGSSRVSQQSGGQPKPGGVSKSYNTGYWGN